VMAPLACKGSSAEGGEGIKSSIKIIPSVGYADSSPYK